MPLYKVPFNGEIEIEADSFDSACEKVNFWRRFVLHEVVQNNYDKLSVRRMSMKRMANIIEITPEYLQSHPARMKIKRENIAADSSPFDENNSLEL